MVGIKVLAVTRHGLGSQQRNGLHITSPTSSWAHRLEFKTMALHGCRGTSAQKTGRRTVVGDEIFAIARHDLKAQQRGDGARPGKGRHQVGARVRRIHRHQDVRVWAHLRQDGALSATVGRCDHSACMVLSDSKWL